MTCDVAVGTKQGGLQLLGLISSTDYTPTGASPAKSSPNIHQGGYYATIRISRAGGSPVIPVTPILVGFYGLYGEITTASYDQDHTILPCFLLIRIVQKRLDESPCQSAHVTVRE